MASPHNRLQHLSQVVHCLGCTQPKALKTGKQTRTLSSSLYTIFMSDTHPRWLHVHVFATRLPGRVVVSKIFVCVKFFLHVRVSLRLSLSLRTFLEDKFLHARVPIRSPVIISVNNVILRYRINTHTPDQANECAL